MAEVRLCRRSQRPPYADRPDAALGGEQVQHPPLQCSEASAHRLNVPTGGKAATGGGTYSRVQDDAAVGCAPGAQTPRVTGVDVTLPRHSDIGCLAAQQGSGQPGVSSAARPARSAASGWFRTSPYSSIISASGSRPWAAIQFVTVSTLRLTRKRLDR